MTKSHGSNRSHESVEICQFNIELLEDLIRETRKQSRLLTKIWRRDYPIFLNDFNSKFKTTWKEQLRAEKAKADGKKSKKASKSDTKPGNKYSGFLNVSKISKTTIVDFAKLVEESDVDFEYYRVLKTKAEFYLHQNAQVFRCFDETIIAPPQDDPRWLVMRNKGIGASEADKVEKWVDKENSEDLTPVQLRWVKEKAGLLPSSFKGNAITDQGHRYEPIAGKILEDMFGTYLLESTSLEHPIYPYVRASLDRYGWINGMAVIIEIKSPVSRIPQHGHIPHGYDLQMYQQHEVSRIENGLFADAQFELFDTFAELNASFKKNERMSDPKKYYGVLIRYPHNKRVVTYSPMSVRTNLREWLKEKKKILRKAGYKFVDPHDSWSATPSHHNEIKIEYWRLHKYVIVPHLRDHNWCKTQLPNFTKMWKHVLKYKGGFRDDDDREREAVINEFSDEDSDDSESAGSGGFPGF